MNEQVEEIQRALDALETYAEQWILETMPNVTDVKRVMWYKNADGSSPWLEIMKIRSELLLARAMATGPLAQAAEVATDEGSLHFCEICKMATDHKTSKHPWPSRPAHVHEGMDYLTIKEGEAVWIHHCPVLEAVVEMPKESSTCPHCGHIQITRRF